MPNLFGEKIKKEDLRKKTGDAFQVCGAKKVVLDDGSEKGVEAFIVKTGSGLNFTVLAGRGLDISSADYCGKSLCWTSSTGDANSAFFEKDGLGWLRTFYGGLLCTCGMTYAGAPTVDEGKPLGLHGRISHIPAKDVSLNQKWEGDDFIVTLGGKMRESIVFGENLLLTREIKVKMGESKIFVSDVIENEGYITAPLMYLYHVNGGYPALDENGYLVSPSIRVVPRDDEAKDGLETYFKFHKPTKGYKEKVYFHKMKPNFRGLVSTALVNKKFNNGQGFGFYITYNAKQLPNFIQWKMMGEGVYACGMEPANCGVEGRNKDRERGTLQHIEPGEKRRFGLEIGVLANKKEIEAFEANNRKILGN